MTSTKILVVDDEPSIRSLLNRVLTREGYQVLMAASGTEALDTATKEKPDLVILDLNLPDVYGEDVCKQIRKDPTIENTPVLILTGKSAEGLSTRCLNGGADSYLPKPFDIEEVLAHLRALLRRANPLSVMREPITRGRMTIRVAERLVTWKGHRLEMLAPKEFELLRALVFHSPQVLGKDMLARQVWGSPFDQLHQRTLDVHIRRIRKKLGPAAAECLKTVPAIGFQWLDEVAVPAAPAPTKR